MADVEARQARCPAEKEQKTDKGSGLQQVHVQLRIQRVGQKVKSPDEGQQAGRHAEGDHVGQRIQLPAEIAGGVGHARDAPVERVEGNGEKDRDRRPVQMALRVAADGVNGLGDGKVAGGNVSGGEYRRQQKHAAAQAGMRFAFDPRRIKGGSCALSRRCGMQRPARSRRLSPGLPP